VIRRPAELEEPDESAGPSSTLIREETAKLTRQRFDVLDKQLSSKDI
jgi:hypothetical protein